MLLEVISRYEYGDFPDSVRSFNVENQQAFSKLRNDLRKAGWGMNLGYGLTDYSFQEAVNNLYNYQK